MDPRLMNNENTTATSFEGWTDNRRSVVPSISLRQLGEQAAGQLICYMLSGLRIGSIDVRLPSGETRHFSGEQPGLHGALTIHNSIALIQHVLAGGEVGFGDAYLDDCWDSPDLTTLLHVLFVNEPYYRGPFEANALGRLYGWLQHRLRANTRDNARRNIEHHYDLGNAFYKLWLDETMAYSSAVFAEPEQSLYDAQLNKFAKMLARLNLSAEHELLEIGSGWGGFAIYAAQQTGCRVHSITLSSEQLAEARRRAEIAGVGDRVRFELRDYRDLDRQYDRVVSIEMYEAVGDDYWSTYFAAINRALRPGCQAAIQGITIDAASFDQYRRKRDFIQKYIFPGGMLCPPTHFQALARSAGLRPENANFYGLDYATTLVRWHQTVLEQRDAIVHQFDERFLRMWRYYLSYCECGFRAGRVDLMQITLHKATL